MTSRSGSQALAMGPLAYQWLQARCSHHHFQGALGSRTMWVIPRAWMLAYDHAMTETDQTKHRYGNILESRPI